MCRRATASRLSVVAPVPRSCTASTSRRPARGKIPVTATGWDRARQATGRYSANTESSRIAAGGGAGNSRARSVRRPSSRTPKRPRDSWPRMRTGSRGAATGYSRVAGGGSGAISTVGSGTKTGRGRAERGGGAGFPPDAAAGAPLPRERKIPGALHAHQRRGDVEEQGRVELAAVHRAVRVFELAGEVEGERIYCEDARPAGAQRRKRLLVRVVAVGGEDDERIHAGLLPVAEQVVHPAVQRLAAHRGVAGERAAGGGVDAVFDRRRAQDLEGRREVVGETLDDERVAAEREGGALLLAGPHQHERSGEHTS